MGHLGILPQTEKKFSFKGKRLAERNTILKDAQLLEKAGIFSVVLECVEMKLSKTITKALKVPTIGIGASAHCDGQVLVTDDLIGLSENKFRFVKKFASTSKLINSAVKKYKSEVIKRQFPKAKHSFKN
jgi:3-methyl-2-oxobutanoate hydroxymethyltransferase